VEYCELESLSQTLIVACGGWSKAKTLYGADQWTDRQDDLLDPHHDAAKIRAFLFSRTGLAAALALSSSKLAKRGKISGLPSLEMGANPHRCEAVPHPWLPTRKELVVR